jgi:hypothetical protein
MAYVATINTPGYLPWDDDPPVFDSAADAWQYLADERERDESDANDGDPELSPTWVELRRMARRARRAERAGRMDDATGSVFGPTPNCPDDGPGLAYSVTLAEPSHRFQCKRCGAESPVGIGYALAPDAEPGAMAPAPDCPNPHVAPASTDIATVS